MAEAAPDTGVRNGGSRRALWSTLRKACSAAALVHAAFLLLFTQLGLPLLIWANIASIMLFMGGRALLLRRQNVLAMILIGGEVVLHATAASVLLGWDSGFHYYLLALVVPLAVVVNGTTLSKSLPLLALGIGYGALDAWTRQVPPVYWLAPAFLDAIRYCNIAGTLAIMTFIALSYYRLVAAVESALRTLASTDPLTGLHNRRHLLEIIRAERRTGPAVTGLFLLLCDIDHFKEVNDRYGHEMGDLVLQRIAGAITGAVRGTDSVARWGGEEFVVLLPGVDFIGAMQTGERIRGAVAGLTLLELATPSQSPVPPLGSLQPAVPVTITVGVARVDPLETIDAAIARADAALYRGKAAGRDRVIADEEAASLPSPEVRP